MNSRELTLEENFIILRLYGHLTSSGFPNLYIFNHSGETVEISYDIDRTKEISETIVKFRSWEIRTYAAHGAWRHDPGAGIIVPKDEIRCLDFNEFERDMVYLALILS